MATDPKRRVAKVATNAKAATNTATRTVTAVAATTAPTASAPSPTANVVDSQLRSISVYACNKEIATIEADPRLDGIDYPLGNDSVDPGRLKRGYDRVGQGGWDVGVTFSDLEELVRLLNGGITPERRWREALGCSGDPTRPRRDRGQGPIRHGEISRLALSSHGDQLGIWFVNALGGRLKSRDDPAYDKEGDFWAPITAHRAKVKIQRSTFPGAKEGLVSTQSVEDIRPLLHEIGLYTRPGSTIILMGCLAGQGPEGTELLKELARIWPHRKVVAFSTIGKVSTYWMAGKGTFRFMAGMKDTGCRSYAEYSSKDTRMEIDFPKLAWASEDSPNAKVVINDGAFRILKCPAEELCPADPAQAPGSSPLPAAKSSGATRTHRR